MTIADLTAEQREELLRRSWMANDGLWFYQVSLGGGVEAANEANTRVVREFAKQEMRRLMRVLGISKVETVEQYRQLYETAVDLFLGSLFTAEGDIAGDVQEINVSQCFAHLGVTRAGIADVYHCGPGERLTGWLEAMGLDAEITPGVGLCQMHHTGSCGYRVALNLAADRPTDAGDPD
jgi:hypothetical protein